MLTALKSTTVNLELFPGVVIPLSTVTPLRAGVATSMQWAGAVDDTVGVGSVVATITDEGLWLNLITDDGVFDMQPVDDDRHVIVEDGREFKPDAAPLIPPASDPTTTPLSEALPPVVASDDLPIAANDLIVQRVLTVYESAARAYFGGDSAAVAAITASINETNQAYIDSGVNVRLESAGIEYVNYRVELYRTNRTESDYRNFRWIFGWRAWPTLRDQCRSRCSHNQRIGCLRDRVDV